MAAVLAAVLAADVKPWSSHHSRHVAGTGNIKPSICRDFAHHSEKCPPFTEKTPQIAIFHFGERAIFFPFSSNVRDVVTDARSYPASHVRPNPALLDARNGFGRSRPENRHGSLAAMHAGFGMSARFSSPAAIALDASKPF